jgi:hypothetical protein
MKKAVDIEQKIMDKKPHSKTEEDSEKGNDTLESSRNGHSCLNALPQDSLITSTVSLVSH